jgi:ribosomal protein S18 acetylase RimI-like enzyme
MEKTRYRTRAFPNLTILRAVIGYRKILIQVRASNIPAQMFYRQLGFVQCGRLARQVLIDEQEDDEILMEFFL